MFLADMCLKQNLFKIQGLLKDYNLGSRSWRQSNALGQIEFVVETLHLIYSRPRCIYLFHF